MRFLIDSMLPPRTAELLRESSHDAVTPADLGAHNLPDAMLMDLAAGEDRVIVTENARDFAVAEGCPVLLVRKGWWRSGAVAENLSASLVRWAAANPAPGPWLHWLGAEYP